MSDFPSISDCKQRCELISLVRLYFFLGKWEEKSKNLATYIYWCQLFLNIN